MEITIPPHNTTTADHGDRPLVAPLKNRVRFFLILRTTKLRGQITAPQASNIIILLYATLCDYYYLSKIAWCLIKLLLNTHIFSTLRPL